MKWGDSMETRSWEEVLDPYRLAVEELVVKFNHIMEEYRHQGSRSPIEQVRGRVKTVASIMEKMQRKNYPVHELEERMEDLAGIRLLCQYMEDIAPVVELIRQRSDMEIKSTKDYIAHAKDSGYRSYHVIIYYEVNTICGAKKLQVEIQIRTLAMDFWATVEHSLAYKYQGNIPDEMKERLSNVAEALLLLDMEMSHVRNEIMDVKDRENQLQERSNRETREDSTLQKERDRREKGRKIQKPNVAPVRSSRKRAVNRAGMSLIDRLRSG